MSDTEQGCRWHFAPKVGGMDDGPNNAMQDTFKQSPFPSLVRESIQNSLDAVLDASAPVKVELAVGGIAKADFPQLMNLEAHLQGCIDYYGEAAKSVYGAMVAALQAMGDNIPYIRVSDYNTRGMDYKPGTTDSTFYSFVHAKGLSLKSSAGSGGSYGYGKAAFYNISPLQTILVSTMTQEGHCFFEGVAMLCTHKIGGEKVEAVGYYDNNDGQPICRTEEIPEPFRRSEPGTTIFILGAADNAEHIEKEAVKATLRNFWMAVERGRLEVSINDLLDVKASTLSMHMDDYFSTACDKPRSHGDKYNPRPYYEAVHLGGTDGHVYRHIERMLPLLGHVELFVKIDPEATTDKVAYLRGPMMTVSVESVQSQNGFYGVFLCDNPQGNALLRNIENPAHNEWNYHNWKDKQQRTAYNPRGKQVTDELWKFIADAKEELFGSKGRDTQDILGLEDLCYIPYGLEEEVDAMSANSISGQQQAKDETQQGWLSTDIKEGAAKPEQQPDPTSQGKVVVKSPNRYHHPTPDGLLVGGAGSGKPTKSKGGGPSSNRLNSHFIEDDTNGIEGTVYQEVPVTYRSFAIKQDGRVVHRLIVHAESKVDDGRIDIRVGGEQANDIVPILTSSVGEVRGNSLRGVQLEEGRNVIEVELVGHMRHAIIINAYEAE